MYSIFEVRGILLNQLSVVPFGKMCFIIYLHNARDVGKMEATFGHFWRSVNISDDIHWLPVASTVSLESF